MRVILNTILAGPDGNAQPGDLLDLPAGYARALIQAGAARPAGRAEAVETAVVGPEETAVIGPGADKPKPRRRTARKPATK